MAGSSESHGSQTPMETTETPAQSNVEVMSLTAEQIRAMKSITEKIYAYREPDGYDPSRLFHRKVNKRSMPDYYDVIKEPVALSTLKAKLLTKEYKSFSEYVRDCALISHNAQTYNRPESGAYQDAVVLRREFEKEFKVLADKGVISQEVAIYPDLGELPPVESPLPAEEEEEDDMDDEEDDEEDEEDSDEDGPKRKRKRGPRSTAAITKREGGKDDGGLKGNDAESRKRRGRPPRVDTPMESRIKAVLKAIRKYKNEHGNVIIHQFEKLPDKVAMPEYYMEIKEPIAIEQIKRKQKRKKYQSVDHFMRDIDVMFNNAKSYNQDESQLYKDAVYLQTETHKLADAEKQKPDTEFQMEEGRLPLPGGILHNGQLWKVGDWIHIQNPNDVTKPVVAQIYRTWQDTDGEKWVNACWYYRPEQTVHQYEKHFYPNEVVKTGQYRDHRVDEIIDRCFVMFITRYSKGRPRGLSADKDVYVCDSRYNEEKHRLNKIKTWASCLPDEVRDQDYPMDMFDGGVKKIKKVPSPILHLLKEDAKETDELPKPRWGADNAPPVVGAVYKGPRDENQSPPPEPTPSPPPPQQQAPPPPPSVAKPPNNPSAYDTPSYPKDTQSDTIMGGYNQPPAASFNPPPQGNLTQSYGSSIPQYNQHSASPAPVHHPHQYTQQTPNSYTQPHPAAASSSHLDHYATPNRYVNQRTAGSGVPAQRLPEVGHLPENANLAIPEATRNQFQQDENGHVLWFTSPPVDTLPPTKPHSAIGHSAKYLAEKIRRKKALKERREAEGLVAEEEEEAQPLAKKVKHDAGGDLGQQIDDLTVKALWMWNEQMQEGTDSIYRSLYGQHWEEGKKYEMEKLARVQADEQRRRSELARMRGNSKSWDAAKASCSGTGVYKDDWDPRF